MAVEKKTESKTPEEGDEKDVDFDQMWDTIIKFNDVMEPIMGPDDDPEGACPRTMKSSCPTGHYLVKCGKAGEYRCAQCKDNAFQPSESWWGDKCRLRKNCAKQNMHYMEFGTPTRDANCACDPGYHFPNEDQRSCVPNKRCHKGYTHGIYGNCESCLEKSMFSATDGTAQKCTPLTNCEKKKRCTVVRSDGTQDNVCGPVVSDLKTCKELEPSTSATSSTTIAIACGIAGAVFLVLFVIVLFIVLRQRRRRRLYRQSRRSLTTQQQNDLRHLLIKEVDQKSALRSKAFSTSFSFIEERINNQIWDLAREVFRSHREKDKYERIVKQYKDTPSQAKLSIREYLHEWKQWRGESGASLEELFKCLHQAKREDITNEICQCLSRDIDSHRGDEYWKSADEESLGQECCAVFFPCRKEKKKTSSSTSWKELSFANSDGVKAPPDQAGAKLLGVAPDDTDDFTDDNNGSDGGQGIGVVETRQSKPQPPPPGKTSTCCQPEPDDRPSPSAPPALEDPPATGYHRSNASKYKYQYSDPVQATS